MINPVALMFALVLMLLSLMTSDSDRATSTEKVLPSATVYLTIDEGYQGAFIEQLKRFAEATSFTVHIGASFNPGVEYNVHLLRADATIWAINAFDPRDFRVYFYWKAGDSVPSNSADTDALVENFLKFASAVSGATVTKNER